MSVMKESIKLRQLAEAIDTLELLEGFTYDVSKVKVEWHDAAALPGYGELSVAISEIVSTQYSALRLQAIEIAKTRVELARLNLKGVEHDR